MKKKIVINLEVHTKKHRVSEDVRDLVTRCVDTYREQLTETFDCDYDVHVYCTIKTSQQSYRVETNIADVGFMDEYDVDTLIGSIEDFCDILIEYLF